MNQLLKNLALTQEMQRDPSLHDKFIGIVLIGGLVGLFIASYFLLLGARVAKIDEQSFGVSFSATFLCVIANFLFQLLMEPVLNSRFVASFVDPQTFSIVAIILGNLMCVYLVEVAFKTNYPKALVAYFVSWLLTIAFCGVVILLVRSIVV